uniref:Uncharacterized protein n=1 Tax=Meloidogyne enterolobii TaxID=390850 RepID=A0A6V7Y9L8_MELEN|nr:unnamed protein product [Meloidogyne enterolobii]
MIDDQKQIYREKIVEYFLNKNGEVAKDDFEHLTNKIKEIEGKEFNDFLGISKSKFYQIAKQSKEPLIKETITKESVSFNK